MTSRVGVGDPSLLAAEGDLTAAEVLDDLPGALCSDLLGRFLRAGKQDARLVNAPAALRIGRDEPSLWPVSSASLSILSCGAPAPTIAQRRGTSSSFCSTTSAEAFALVAERLAARAFLAVLRLDVVAGVAVGVVVVDTRQDRVPRAGYGHSATSSTHPPESGIDT